MLASLCFLTLEQTELQQYISINVRVSIRSSKFWMSLRVGRRERRTFHLHAQGTVYEVTPVVTGERKGPETDWEIVNDNVSLLQLQLLLDRLPQT